jgi:hypothetical protein
MSARVPADGRVADLPEGQPGIGHFRSDPMH